MATKGAAYMADYPIVKDGDVKKRGGSQGGWKTWKSRWFVLDTMRLAYFDSKKAYDKGKAPIGLFDLGVQGAYTVREGSSDPKKAKKVLTKGTYFEIVNNKEASEANKELQGIMLCQTDSKEQMHEWVSSIQQVIDSHAPRRSSADSAEPNETADVVAETDETKPTPDEPTNGMETNDAATTDSFTSASAASPVDGHAPTGAGSTNSFKSWDAGWHVTPRARVDEDRRKDSPEEESAPKRSTSPSSKNRLAVQPSLSTTALPSLSPHPQDDQWLSAPRDRNADRQARSVSPSGRSGRPGYSSMTLPLRGAADMSLDIQGARQASRRALDANMFEDPHDLSARSGASVMRSDGRDRGLLRDPRDRATLDSRVALSAGRRPNGTARPLDGYASDAYARDMDRGAPRGVHQRTGSTRSLFAPSHSPGGYSSDIAGSRYPRSPQQRFGPPQDPSMSNLEFIRALRAHAQAAQQMIAARLSALEDSLSIPRDARGRSATVRAPPARYHSDYDNFDYIPRSAGRREDDTLSLNLERPRSTSARARPTSYESDDPSADRRSYRGLGDDRRSTVDPQFLRQLRAGGGPSLSSTQPLPQYADRARPPLSQFRASSASASTRSVGSAPRHPALSTDTFRDPSARPNTQSPRDRAAQYTSRSAEDPADLKLRPGYVRRQNQPSGGGGEDDDRAHSVSPPARSGVQLSHNRARSISPQRAPDFAMEDSRFDAIFQDQGKPRRSNDPRITVTGPEETRDSRGHAWRVHPHEKDDRRATAPQPFDAEFQRQLQSQLIPRSHSNPDNVSPRSAARAAPTPSSPARGRLSRSPRHQDDDIPPPPPGPPPPLDDEDRRDARRSRSPRGLGAGAPSLQSAPRTRSPRERGNFDNEPDPYDPLEAKYGPTDTVAAAAQLMRTLDRAADSYELSAIPEDQDPNPVRGKIERRSRRSDR